MRELLYRFEIMAPVWLMRLLKYSVALSVITVIFFITPNSITNPIKNDVYSISQAIKWEFKAIMHSEDGVWDTLTGKTKYQPYKESGGVFRGITKDGDLILDGYSGNQIKAELADLVIQDISSVARYLAQFEYQHVFLEVYKAGDKDVHVVKFKNGKPLNLLLIEEKLAHASPNPPTSILDRMMATYWWNVYNKEVPLL